MEEWREFRLPASGKRRKKFRKFLPDCLSFFFFFFKEGRSFAVRRKGMRHIGLQEISHYLEEFLKEFIDNLLGTH